MKNCIVTVSFCLAIMCIQAQTNNYKNYHQKVLHSEQLVSQKRISEARLSLDSIFSEYNFVFLREFKLAAELGLYDKDYDRVFELLQRGILSGWTMKDMEKNKAFRPLHKDQRWETLKADYDSLRAIYTSNINKPLKKETYEMFKDDQKIAFRIWLRFREKSSVKYSLKKFAPHSEKVLLRLNEILEEQGYPGEKLIGNGWWTSVNLSHHNSMGTEYTKKDTLYLSLRPKLENALERGELHPKEYAIIEDWRNASIHSHKTSLYGFVGKIPNDSELIQVNQNRAKIGLRSTELRNKLLDIEKELDINLHLPKGWQKNKITVSTN